VRADSNVLGGIEQILEPHDFRGVGGSGDDIMQGADFLAQTIFQWRCFNNVTYMCTMDLMWSVVPFVADIDDSL